MANSFTLKSTTYDGRYMQLTCTQKSNGSASNSSTVTWTLSTVGGNSNYYSTGPTTVVIGGTTVYSKGRVEWNSKTFPASKGSVSGTITLGHNNDGKRSVSVSFRTAIYTGTVSVYSGTWNLDAIPRYAKITTFTVSPKDETSLTVTWASDAACDWGWYSIDNGNTWVSGLSYPTQVISGLRANTSYNVKIRVRRKDSQLTTDSSVKSAATYNYPHCTNSPDFKIGDSVTLTFYNPLKRTFNFNVIANGIGLSYTWTVKGDTSHKEIWPDNVQTQLYASIPNAKSGTYKVVSTYGNSVITRDTHNTYAINESDCYPIFSDFTYRDVSDIADITDNDQIIVKGNSILQVIIPADKKAVAKNSATIEKYTISIDALNVSAPYSSGENVVKDVGVINSYGEKRLSVTAFDSRGLPTVTYKDIYVHDYSKPTINADAKRLNNFEAQTTIKVNGDYTPLMIDGVSKNSIQITKYRDKETNGSFNDWTDLTTTVTDNKFTCNDIILPLDNSKSFEIEIYVGDLIHPNSTSVFVDEGQAIFFISSNKKECYINGKRVIADGDFVSVTETGTDGIWTYRKWSDGTAECWGKHTATNVTISISARGSYYYTMEIPIPENLFVYGPQINANANLSAGFCYVGISNAYTSKIAIILVTQEIMPSVTCVTHLALNGRWK